MPIPLSSPVVAVAAAVSYPSYASLAAYAAFLLAFPQYQLTAALDRLRQREFPSLTMNTADGGGRSGGICYLDHTPRSLMRQHLHVLDSCLLGNPHSKHAPSHAATLYEQGARAAVLDFFRGFGRRVHGDLYQWCHRSVEACRGMLFLPGTRGDGGGSADLQANSCWS